MRNLSAGLRRRGQHEFTRHGVFRHEARIAHHQARNAVLDPILVPPPVIRLLIRSSTPVLRRLHGVIDRECNADLGCCRAGIRNPIAQNGHRQTRVVRIMRNERRKRIELDPHRQRVVLEIDMRQRIFAGEGSRLKAAESRSVA